MRAGAFTIVNFRISSLGVTSLHASGIDTGAPGKGRALKGATSKRPWPFCT